MKLAWATDIHLNFLNLKHRMQFYDEFITYNPCDAILITGDIAEAEDFLDILKEMQEETKKQIYFVLGNHDYYHGSIAAVNQSLQKYDKGDLIWLSHDFIKLSKKTALIGVDGWYDGRNGDYEGSDMLLNDFLLIDELFTVFRKKDKQPLLDMIQFLADGHAEAMSEMIDEAADSGVSNIIIGTHIPPFPESAKYRGKISDKNALPFYSSKIMGEVLLGKAKKYPNIDFQVYCGHSHGAAFYNPLPNLCVTTGEAHYNYPTIQKIIEIE